MSGFEDFLSSQANATPGAASAATAPPPEVPPADALAPPDDFAKFLAKAKGEQDAGIVQAAQAATVANVHSGISADAAGQAAKTGRQLGIPQAAVETDPQTFHAQAKAQANASLLSSNPVLAQWVAANPDSARIAQDEYQQLSSVEKMWQEVKNAGYGTIQALGGAYNASALAMNRAIAPNALAPWLFQAPDAQAWWQRNMIGPLEQDKAQTFDAKTPGVGAALGQFAGSFAGLMSQVMTTSGVHSAAAPATAGLLTTIANAAQNAVRAMWLPSATAAINTGHDVMSATGDTAAAVEAAAGAYAFGTLQGAVPFSAPGGLLSRAASGFVSGVATSEGQRAAMNLVLPPQMQKGFDVQEAIAQGAQSMLLGAFLGPRRDPSFAEHIRQTYVDAAKAETAQRDLAKVAALGRISAESKLRESDPDAFHDFVSQVTDKTDLDAVYVNGAKLSEAFAQSKIDPIPSVADKMQEALATGGDVRIPIADYATHIAGTDLEKAILPDMKAAPDGMTYSEGRSFYQDAAKTLTEKARQMADQRQQRVDLDDDKGRVYQNILDQLTATGRNPSSVNKAYATLVSEFYATMGQREGLYPTELFNEMPLRVQAEQSAARDAFAQPDVRDASQAPSSEGLSNAEVRALRQRATVLTSLMTSKASLTGSMKKAGSLLHPEDKAAIQSRALELKRGGMKQAEASRQAVRERRSYLRRLAADPLAGEERPLGQGDRGAFSPTEAGDPLANERTGPAAALLEVGKHERLFQYPKSDAKTMEEIAADKRPDLKVEAETVTQMDGSEKHTGIWNVTTPQGQHATITQRGQKVFINVAGLKEGGGGSLVYDLAANYARNNGLKFVGDPAGLTKASMVRRAENMLSSAVKYGTTDHLEPHPDQSKGNKTIPGVEWKDGDTLGNVRALMDATLAATDTLAPVGSANVHLDAATHSLVDGEGHRLDGEDLSQLLGFDGREEGAGAPGNATLRRAALIRSLLSGVEDRRAIVEQLRRIESAGSEGAGSPLDRGFYQGERGAFDPVSRTIALLKGADLSTFIHESGHFFLDSLQHVATRDGASEGAKADFDTLLKWFGVKDAQIWAAMSVDEQRVSHEKFAKAFEHYVFEGQAPNLQLQPLFSRFRSWLMSVYKSLVNVGAEINPEVRGVFDRMLATDEAIRQAEQLRSFAPLFTDAKAMGKGAAEFNAYQALGQEATDAAVADMQARSMRDMQWLSNAKHRALKALQRQAAAARKEVAGEVENEVAAYPAYQAQEFMRANAPAVDAEAMKEWTQRRDAVAESARESVKADLLAANPTAKGLQKGQLLAKNKRVLDNQAEALVLEWEKANQKPKAPEQSPMVAEMVAEKFGFASGDDMRRAIMEAGDKKDIVAALTDQRMMQRHGELTDAQSIEAAANDAVHNEVRARFMATGLKALTDSPLPANQIAKAAKQVAEGVIAGKAVGELRADQYLAAEARANREAIAAAAKDPAKAIDAQRAALLNNRLFKAATQAAAEVQRGLDYLRRFGKDSFRSRIDVDVRDQADDLLSRFDLRQNPSGELSRPEQNLKDWADSQMRLGYSPNLPADMLDSSVRMHYKDMTFEQFRGLVDSLRTLESIGRQRKEITLEGKKIDLDKFVENELVPKLRERGERFTQDELLDRPEERHTNPVAIALDHLGSWMRSVVAQLKPQSFKANEYDRHEILGPFNSSVVEPIINANYNKVRMLKELSNDFARVGERLGREWQDSLREPVANTRLMDPDKGVPMKFTRGKLLGLMIRGIGNESNLDKMAKGWGWDKADVWAFVHEHATAKDFEAAQAVGDLFEKHWPEIEAMNRRLGNTPPDKIEPRAFPSKFGEQRGWYAPIDYDALRSRRGERAATAESINPSEGLFGSNYYRADTTTNGSLNARLDNYTDRVDLDYHTLPQRLQETIHDLAYRETLIDVSKVLNHPSFRREFRSAYGREAYSSMQDWLGNVANSVNYDRQVGALGRFLSYTRTGIVMNAIALRATTVLKHGGSAGIKTMGYFAGGGETYLASRMAQMGTDYRNQIQGAKDKFGEINARLLQQDRDFRSTSASMFERESARAKAERFGHAAVAWSDMMTAVPTAWAAYDRAITEGIPVSQGGTGVPMTEKQAVNYANRIVREAHGSNVEAARSMVMNNHSEAMKMFTTLYGFMNNSFGQQLDGFDKLRTNGMSKTPVLARTFMAIVVPALWAHYLTHGKADDDKHETWWGWAAKAIAGEVAASVPFVRDAFSMVEGYSHAGLVSAENWMATMIQAGRDVAKLSSGEKSPKAPIKDISNAAGMGLHIPGLGQLGTSAQYVADVHSGEKQPKNAAEYAKGLVTGH